MLKTMKRKWISILLVIMSLFVLAGCSFGATLDDVKEQYGLVARVTYYANGGAFEGSDSKTTKDMYYASGAKAVNIGSSEVQILSGTISISRTNYQFGGWYFVTLTEEGEPQKDENGAIVLGEAVDFSVRLQKDDHWHVAAKWIAKEKLNVYLTGGVTITYEEQEYTQGSFVKDYNFGVAGEVSEPTREPFKGVSGFTYIDYYYDEACTQPVEWPVKKSEAGGDVNIYVKYLPGKWTVLRKTNDVKSFFTNGMASANNKYCLSRDVDLDGDSVTLIGKNFACELDGFGFTLKNFTVKRVGINNTESASLFGAIKASAKMKNITISDVKAEFSLKPPAGDVIGSYNTYLFCTSVESGVEFTAVKFGGTLTVDAADNTYINNIPKEGETYVMTNYIFGGWDTDAAFLAEIAGVTIVGTPECTIK